MNCKRIEELLPLHVGRDLDVEQIRKVTAHVQGCTSCSRSLDDYVETSQLMRSFEPPQISESSYAAMRRNVLNEIERKAGAPALLEFMMRPFQTGLRWAVPAALLLAACMFAYYFVSTKKGSEHQASVPNKTLPVPTAPTNGLSPTPSNSIVQATSNPNKAGRKFPVSPRRLAVHSNATESGRVAKAVGKPVSPLKTLTNFSPAPRSVDLSAAADKTLRLEIQTSDPNIRIIWFSHPPDTGGSPNESSKGF